MYRKALGINIALWMILALILMKDGIHGLLGHNGAGKTTLIRIIGEHISKIRESRGIGTKSN